MTDVDNHHHPRDSWKEKYEQERELERQAILYRIHETHRLQGRELDNHQISSLAIAILTNPDYLEEVVQAYLTRGRK